MRVPVTLPQSVYVLTARNNIGKASGEWEKKVCTTFTRGNLEKKSYLIATSFPFRAQTCRINSDTDWFLAQEAARQRQKKPDTTTLKLRKKLQNSAHMTDVVNCPPIIADFVVVTRDNGVLVLDGVRAPGRINWANKWCHTHCRWVCHIFA